MVEKIKIWARDWWLDGNWMRDFYYWIRKLSRAIKRFWGWFFTIWNDEDWDYVYILRSLRYKIQRTRDNIQENHNHEECEKTVADMDHILEVLDRVMECNYCTEEFDAHMAKWGGRRMVDSGKGYSTMAPTSEEQRADFSALCDRMNAAEKADWDELWSALSKDLKTFWD